VGDTVLLRAEPPHLPPYVARLEALYSEHATGAHGPARAEARCGHTPPERDRVGSHGRWTRPCLQTAHMTV
jgi:hypothetical protein